MSHFVCCHLQVRYAAEAARRKAVEARQTRRRRRARTATWATGAIGAVTALAVALIAATCQTPAGGGDLPAHCATVVLRLYYPPPPPPPPLPTERPRHGIARALGHARRALKLGPAR